MANPASDQPAAETPPRQRWRRLPDESIFPVETEDLEWRLRHAPESITREDQLFLASICSAYRYLVHETTQKRRNAVIRQLRE